MLLPALTLLAVLQDSTASSRTLARLVAEHERRLQSEARGLAGGGAQRMPDITAARVARDGTRARAIVRELDLLKPKEVSADEWITSRILRWELLQDVETARFYDIAFTFVTPYSSPLAALPGTFEALPLTNAAETQRYLAMVDSVAILADTIRGALESRRRKKILLPKDEVRLIVPFLRSFGPTADRSPFTVAPSRLSALAPAARNAFIGELGGRLGERVRPAFERLAAWLEGPYLAEAPERVGLAQYPNGAAYYRSLVRRHTTLEATPEQVHAIGLAEVARIDSAMSRIRAELGINEPKAAFHERLAKDPRFFAKTPAEFGEKLMYHDQRIRLRIGEQFATMPRAQGDVRRLDPRLEASMTYGYYQVPTPQDSLGHYMYNGSNLPERTMLTAASLIFHELVPGHHFQFSLARESRTLPWFRRNATYTAFVEGWGEYAASVAGEMGMYSDPYDRYGRLAMDMFFACRLVVDTGMHALGWTRARAMAYMKEHTLQSDLQINTETLRYAADLPGQALAYKMGAKEFLRLREDARRRLGARFDIKRWHALVLEGGAMPFTILKQRVDAWVAAGGL